MNDPLDDRITDALRSEATLSPDADAAFATFEDRRHLRRRRTLAVAASALAVVVIGAGVALRGGGHRSDLTAAGQQQSTSEEPAAGVEGATDVTSSTINAIAGSSVTTLGSSGGGGAPAPHNPAATSPAATAPSNGNFGNDNFQMVVVTEADNGKTFTLQSGRNGLFVQLSKDNVWTEPQSSDAKVLPKVSGSTNGDGSAQATFSAGADGQATVTAQGRSQPLPCQTAKPTPCMVPDHIVEFRITVNVVG